MQHTRHPGPTDLLQALCAGLLISLFCYAATSKLLDFDLFRGQLLNQDLPPPAARALAWLLPPAELAAAALLLFRRSRFAGFAAAFSLLFLFSGYIALVLAGYWQRIPCSCGGVLGRLPWGAHLVFNLFFLAAALSGLLRQARARPG
jgi:putative oxidoreductase